MELTRRGLGIFGNSVVGAAHVGGSFRFDCDQFLRLAPRLSVRSFACDLPSQSLVGSIARDELSLGPPLVSMGGREWAKSCGSSATVGSFTLDARRLSGVQVEFGCGGMDSMTGQISGTEAVAPQERGASFVSLGIRCCTHRPPVERATRARSRSRASPSSSRPASSIVRSFPAPGTSPRRSATSPRPGLAAREWPR